MIDDIYIVSDVNQSEGLTRELHRTDHVSKANLKFSVVESSASHCQDKADGSIYTWLS